MAVLYGNGAFSILVFSTKKWCSSFLKKGFVFQKICFKVKVLKTFKFSLIVICQSLKRRICHMPISHTEDYFENPYYRFFRRIFDLSVGFKMNPLNFTVKLAERRNNSFLLSTWCITFFKHLYTLICVIECIDCVNIWKRSETAKQPFLYWIK